MYAIVLFAFLSAIVGYGTIVQRAVHGEARDIAYSAALGIATLIVIGGVLNTLGLAYGPAIDCVMLGGVALALASFARMMASAGGRAQTVNVCRRILRWPPAWLVVICLAFATFFFAPTQSYNPHDDLAQYLTRPYVMMTFGSIGANWFDSTGADSLGVQSWLLAFFLRYLPLAYANVLDAAIMLSLTCAMLAALGARLGTSAWLTAAAVLMFLLLNPSQVNVSAVYSLTLMVAGLAMALLRTAEAYLADGGNSRRWLLGLVPAGVFLAALPALKATSALWGVLFAFAFVCAAAISFRTWRDAIAAVAVVGASGAATVALWLLPFLPFYRASLVVAQEWPDQPMPAPYCSGIGNCLLFAWTRFRDFTWFSLEPVQYGQIGLSFTLCGLIILIALLRPIISSERSKASRLPSLLAFSAIGIAAIAFFLAAPMLFPWGYLRYSSPITFIAACLGVLFAGAATVRAAEGGVLRLSPSWRWGVALLVPMVPIALLAAGDLKERLAFAVNQRTSTQLARLPEYQEAVNRLLSPEQHDQIRALQSRIPPGSSILAAITTPTHLDFERNPIFPHFHAALSTPWWGDLSPATPADLRRILVSRGIDYVIWQHGGEFVYPDQELVELTNTHARVLGVAARNALPFRRAVKAQKIGPTVYRGAHYMISRVVEPYDAEPPSDYLIALGSPINFAAGTDYTPHLLSGWSFREAPGVWSDGPTAVVRFDLERHPEQPLRLAAELRAYTVVPAASGGGAFTEGPPLAVTVEANGRRVAAWSLTNTPSVFCATIPAEAVPAQTVSITFKIPDPKSPLELGLGVDTRRIGILLKRAALSADDNSEARCSLDS